ncbi:MAG: nucleotidyltransferase domain-containing protein [Clostridiales bacterium]|jgi:predicted nucleotidyltransferase|nr:nucleotidyltransferase domain-containing protein [Clostridiales bacterium]
MYNQGCHNQVYEKLREFFLLDENVLLALIFGSFGTPEESTFSDIDIAVLLRDKISLKEELRMSAELTQVLSREDIDLVILRQASINITYRALSTGRIVFEREPLLVSDFIEYTINNYLDFGIRLMQMDREFDESLREKYIYG